MVHPLAPVHGPEVLKARRALALSLASLGAGAVLLAIGQRQVAWYGFVAGNLGFAMTRRMEGFGPRFRRVTFDGTLLTFTRPWAWVVGMRKDTVRRPSDLALRSEGDRWALLGLPAEVHLGGRDPIAVWLMGLGVPQVD